MMERSCRVSSLAHSRPPPSNRSGLFVRSDGTSHRWDRTARRFSIDDWSGREEIMEWLALGRSMSQSSWGTPVWAGGLGTTALLHATPLRHDGAYLGLLGQVVPISDLSTTLANDYADDGLTPFVLYDKQFVLAASIAQRLAGPRQIRQHSVA